MQIVRDVWIRPRHENLFNDQYGVLKLAADATLTKTPVYSKISGYFFVKWRQLRKHILTAIKQFWQDNTVTCSDFIWLEPEGLTYKIIDELRVRALKKADISSNKISKKINYKRKSKGHIP